MDQRGKIILVIIIVAVFAGLAIVEFVSMRNGNQSPIRQAVRGMLDAPERAPETPPPDPSQSKEPAQQDRRPAAGSSSSSSSGSNGASRRAATAEPAAPVVVVPKPPPPPISNAAPAPVFSMQQRRSDTFVPGNLRGWIGYGVTFDHPLLVRAGGELRAGDQISGPDGLRPEAGGDRRIRVMPAAPYLALIGRVCSSEECSAPFVIGAHAVLCPSSLGVRGDLQLWTNNYVQIDGYQTLQSYTAAAGGYRFQAEPASQAACDGNAASADAGKEATALPDNRPLKDPEFTVSSRQNSWKPFFVALDRAFVIRATGQVQPQERVRATGPNGIDVPQGTRWTYPGAKTVVVDAEHVLLEPSLPYQSLIGRVCGAKECSAPFLVGSERTVCPSARFTERLELWINHIVPKTGTRNLPFADLTFQSRRGEYRFEIASAPACGEGAAHPQTVR
jgi:hypothetical protein